jgi:hypothetical protein
VPQVVPIIVNFWCRLNTGSQVNLELMVAVILALTHMSTMSEHNLVAMHSTKITITFLKQLAASPNVPGIESALKDLCSRLLSLGINDAEDAAILVRLASSSEVVASQLAQLTRTTAKPPEFHFDLSFDGYAAIEFEDLPFAFPPQQSGYTLSMWLDVSEFDDTCHTTLLGIFDASQSCFLLVYIEQATHQLVLQTSMNSKKPSIKFQSVTLDEKKSYHIALAHHRSSQQTCFYINGQLQEQLECPYPRQSVGQQRVQAFIGTPHDLASRLGRNMVSTKWSLSILHIFSEFLPPESVLVYHKLGSAYCGSYRDDLGTFLTYTSSADLTLKDERLSRDKHSKLGLGDIIRRKQLKDDLILVVNPSLYFHHDRKYCDLLMKTKASVMALKRQLQSNDNGFVVNAASVDLGHAVADASKLGHLTNGVVVCKPRSIADQYWQLGGAVPIMLVSVGGAATLMETTESIRSIFSLIQHSWRLSNAFETANAFALLAWILRLKLCDNALDIDHLGIKRVPTSMVTEPAMLTLFSLLLASIGIDCHSPKLSLITNPLAYRYLILDTALWNYKYPSCQRLFYEHLVLVLEESRYKNANIKHLTRMRK